METDLKCNRLTCRRSLTDKAVVTTCSHIFCVDCANELFNAARLCPACETSLTQPDDVVVCSLQPTNDYKTSVLSGLSPAIILEISSRAISFWQYQIHQENAFQQAVIRNLSDKNAQLQKQLENVIREANGELDILNDKRAELERDLELERRKVREVQEAAREKDKEYQRLKAQLDKMKRKTLLAPNVEGHPGHGGPLAMQTTPAHGHGIGHGMGLGHAGPVQLPMPGTADGQGLGLNVRRPLGFGGGKVSAVVGGMEANGIQRTPLGPTNGSGRNPTGTATGNRGPFVSYPSLASTTRTNTRSDYGSASDRSGSVQEVERMLRRPSMGISTGGWQTGAAEGIQRTSMFPLMNGPHAQKQSHGQQTTRGFRPAR